MNTLNKARLFLATPFIALAFIVGVSFALICLLAALIGGKSIDDIDNIFKKGK